MQSLPMQILFVAGNGGALPPIDSLFSHCLAHRWTVKIAAGCAAGLRELRGGVYDACVLDAEGERPDDALGFLRQAEQFLCSAPIVVLHHWSSPLAGVSVIRAGASDCIPWERLPAESLESCILHAVERWKRQQCLQGAGEPSARCPGFFEFAPDACFATDEVGVIRKFNHEAVRRLGVEPSGLLGLSLASLVSKGDRDAFADLLAEEWGACRRKRIAALLQPPAMPPFYAEIWVSADASGTAGENAGWLYWVVRDVGACKQAEIELRESEGRFRLIAETIREVFWVRTVDRLLYISPACEEVFGRSRDFFYKNLNLSIDMIHPGDRERLRKLLDARWEEAAPLEAEFRVVHPDGNVRWIYARSFPARDEAGELRCVGIAEDITARREIEGLLRTERNLAIQLGAASSLHEALEVLLETALNLDSLDNGGVYLVDRGSEELRLVAHKGLSPRFASEVRRYGAGAPHYRLVMRGKPIYWSSDDPRGAPEMPELCHEEGLRAVAIIPVTYENRTVASLCLGSHVQSVIPESVRNALEAFAAHIGGIVLRAQAEDSLRRSEELFRDLAENIRDVFWIRTPKKMLYVSPAYEEIWGESCGEPLAGDALVRGVHPEDRVRVEAAHRQGRRTGRFVEEYRIIRPDGTMRWVRTRSFPVEVDGVLDRIVGVAEDVTAAKAAEEALRTERSSLDASHTALKVLIDQRERDRETLRGSVLDNLKTLVTPYIDKLKNTRLSDEQRSYVESIATHILGVALPFVRSLTERFLGLTPTEIRVAELIRGGSCNKEIAQTLWISEGTVRSHRESLRRKLGLTNQKVNLRSFLQLV